MTTAILGATRALPFLVGAAIIFSGGIALYYRSCLSQARLALEKLSTSHAAACRWQSSNTDVGGVRALLDGRDNEWTRKSMLVTAWQCAGPALDEIAIVADILQRTDEESLERKDSI